MQRCLKIITSLTGVMPVSTTDDLESDQTIGTVQVASDTAFVVLLDEDGDELRLGVDDAALGGIALFLRLRFIYSPFDDRGYN